MKIVIIGLGLIGGSLAAALKGHHEILGFDENKIAVETAMNKGIISRAVEYSQLKTEKPDIVVIAVPVKLVASVSEKVYTQVGNDSIITDVGSVKGNLKNAKGRVVGGHPMAGTENSGIDWAFSELFKDKFYCLVSYENTLEEDVASVREAFSPIGCQFIRLTAQFHDRLVANISHLPHAVAYSLASTLSNEKESVIAGTGFLDTTRIASSSPDFWTSVFLLNKENVLDEIAVFQGKLNELYYHIDKGDEEAIHKFLSKAKVIRDELKKQ